jgi:hypothetical protein
VTPSAFAAIYPRLYHMTAAGGWEGIRAHGLLTVAQLLERHEADAGLKETVRFSRRAEAVTLAPGVTIRDNKVLNEASLARALTGGLTPRDWYGMLNERAFLWVNPKRLDKLLAARAYRGSAHDVLTFETLPFLEACGSRAEVTPMNTGAAFMRAVPRGRESFVPLADLPFDEWKAKRGRADAVVEVAVRGGVPEAGRFLTEVRRRQAGEEDVILYQRAA